MDKQIKTGIYKIVNTVNGKMYVGSAADMDKRWKNHVKELNWGKHHSKKLQNAWLKYGSDVFEFSVICPVENPDRLLSFEQFWIEALETVRLGYNISPTAGSPRGVKHTEEARKNMSDAHKGYKLSPERIAAWIEAMKPHRTKSAETIAKMVKANTGKKRTGQALENVRAATIKAHKGRTHSPEEIELRASKLRGRTHTDQARANMSAGQTGLAKSPETKQKLSEALKRLGIAPSQAAREKSILVIKAKWAAWRAAKEAAKAENKDMS